MVVKVQAAQAQAVGEPSEPVQGFGFQEEPLGLVPDPPSEVRFCRHFSRHRTYDEERRSTPKRRGGWGGRGKGSRTDIAVDECRKQMIDRVARYRFD